MNFILVKLFVCVKVFNYWMVVRVKYTIYTNAIFMKNENGNLLTTYVVECFDEENALCQIKTYVSVKFSVLRCFIYYKNLNGGLIVF